MQSEQNRWRHSLVVIVFFSMSRQMGHMSSECSDRGETAISVPSMMASWKHQSGKVGGGGLGEKSFRNKWSTLAR